MSNIDYQSYTIEQLLDAKSSINKEAYPDNYKALTDELDSRGLNGEDCRQQRKELKVKKAKKRVKVVGVFQLLAVLVIPVYMILVIFSGQSYSVVVYTLAMIFMVINGIAGWTAFRGIEKYYWVSILNQSLQLFGFAVGSVVINYSGIGGIYTIFEWGDIYGFEFLATFNPGFNFQIFDQPLPSNHLAIDIMAIIFISALITGKQRAQVN